MTTFKCPGQDSRYWTAEDIFDVKCPFCNNEIEFFKDEPFRICPKCAEEVRNPRIDLGCAQWCKFAKKCLGVTDDSDIMLASMCQRLVVQMQKYFGNNQTDVDHAMKILRYAEEISKNEPGAPLAIRAAAILYEVDVPEKIMAELDIENDTIMLVSEIIKDLHTTAELDLPESKIIHDAVQLADMKDNEEEKTLITETGRGLIKKRFPENNK